MLTQIFIKSKSHQQHKFKHRSNVIFGLCSATQAAQNINFSQTHFFETTFESMRATAIHSTCLNKIARQYEAENHIHRSRKNFHQNCGRNDRNPLCHLHIHLYLNKVPAHYYHFLLAVTKIFDDNFLHSLE